MLNNVKTLKIRACESTRTGESVKNQYIIEFLGGSAFQSYNSLIAVYDRENQKLTLGCDWDYSRTTQKYLYQYLRNYCYSIVKQLPSGKSFADSIRKAFASGLIVYDKALF